MSPITVLLIIGSCFVTLKLYSFSDSFKKEHFTCLFLASLIFLGIQISAGINEVLTASFYQQLHEILAEWGHIVSLSLILGSLAIFIRRSKPVFAQFPKIYAALPILLILSYVLVYDTYALKSWLLFLYQGGAILISLLLFGVYAYRSRDYFLMPVGIGVICINYLLYWNIPALGVSFSWVWKLLLLVGMVIVIYGLQPFSHHRVSFRPK